MRLNRTFRFQADDVNQLLIDAVDRASIIHAIDTNGVVYYHADDEEAFENFVSAIRDKVFKSWQILSCPADWADRYRLEMKRRKVAYQEELNNGSVEFLMPQNVKPHSWKLT